MDILVKWRGDEETGRDQLDEILREVVIISDSESDKSDDEDAEASSFELISDNRNRRPSRDIEAVETTKLWTSQTSAQPISADPPPALVSATAHVPSNKRKRASEKKSHRGFKRYRAWQEAIQRNRTSEHAL